jgi:hypothetical protein
MKPSNGIITGLALAVVFLTAISVTPAARAGIDANRGEVVANNPQTAPGDAWSARPGLPDARESDRYERLLHSDPDFRAVRERTECGPTDTAPMRAECNASLGR